MGRMHPIAFAFILSIFLTVLGAALAIGCFLELRRRQLSREASTLLEGKVVDIVFRTDHPTQPGRRHALIEVELPDGSNTIFEDPVELDFGAVAAGHKIEMRYDLVSGHLEVAGAEDQVRKRGIPVRWRALAALISLVSGVALTSYVVQRYGERLW